MNRRKFDKYWVWLGALLGPLFLLSYIKLPDISLEVLSIFFGALLAIASILPSIQNYKKIEFIKKSGHIQDLIDYIQLPLTISFILIILEFTNRISMIPKDSMYHLIFPIFYLSLWGVFFCCLFRILKLVPKLISDNL